MSISRGFRTIMGVKAEGTLGTPVAVDAKIPFISETFDDAYAHIQNAALTGSGAPKPSIQGARQVPGGVLTYWHYGTAQALLTAYFGTFTTVAGGNDHYDIAEVLDGLGLTVAFDKQVSVHEYAGFKPGELTLSGSPTDAVRLALTGFATARALDSVVNTSNVLAALDESPREIQFHDLSGSGYVRLGDLADALSSSDDLSITEFALTSNRNLQQDPVNSRTLLEAVENNFRVGTLTLNIPRYQSDQFLTWHANHTVLQCELRFDNGVDPAKIVQLPQLLVVTAPTQTGGPGLIPVQVTLSLHNNRDGANTFMAFSEELRIFEADNQALGSAITSTITLGGDLTLA